MTVPETVGWALTALLGGVLVAVWWKADTRIADLTEQVTGLQRWADDIADWIEEQFGGPLPLAIVDDRQPDPDTDAGGPDTVIAHPSASQVRRTELLRPKPAARPPRAEVDLSRFSFNPDGRRHG